jgi:hypothetical protein
MSTPIYCKDIDSHLDRKCLKECLEDALRQVDSSQDEIVFSFGNVEVHVDYPNDEIYVVV